MKTIMRAILSATLLTLTGCASITYLPTDESVTYEPTDSIKVYWEKPEEPYNVIGRISATSEDYGEQDLFIMIKKRAMLVGAHAIIMGSTDQDNEFINTPMSGGGTMILPVTSTRIEAIAIRFDK